MVGEASSASGQLQQKMLLVTQELCSPSHRNDKKAHLGATSSASERGQASGFSVDAKEEKNSLKLLRKIHFFLHHIITYNKLRQKLGK